jgi:transcriptional regulator with XRE-family HTH domain
MDLARLVAGRTTAQGVSTWERGISRPVDATLLRIAQILGRDFAWFFTESDA